MRLVKMMLTLGLAGVMFGQELVIIPRAPLALAQATPTPPVEVLSLAQAQASPAQAPAPAPPQPATARKKSHKKTWIVVGVVAAGAVAGLVAVNRRLSNEGHGIF